MVIFLVTIQDTAKCGDREYFMELKKKEGLDAHTCLLGTLVLPQRI